MDTPSKTRYDVFVENLSRDVFFFIFILLLLSFYRAAFLFNFRGLLLPDTPPADLWLTMWYGLRISLKTAGALFLPSFVLGTLAEQIWLAWPAEKVRNIWAFICIFGLSLLFQARIPYYHEFNNAFSPFVFNTLHDDVGAIISTSVMQYGAVWRILAAAAMAAVFGWCFRGWIKLADQPAHALKMLPWKKTAAVCLCVLLAASAVYVRHGGSWGYEGSIYWKNAARMNQHLLNEAILDDIQALYKASRIYKQFAASSSDIDVSAVREAAARLQGRTSYQEDSLLPFLTRQASGAVIDKPRHIFLIVAETYMLWPLWEEYSSLPIAQGMREIINRPDSIFVRHFLPASNGTMFGLTSVLLGLPEVNLLTANRPSARQPYETALSVQLKKQGYKTRFFYGGFPSWENVGVFMDSQQMDESFYYADFGGEGGVWGVEDKIFLQGIAEKITPEPSFNLILTSSNHTPLVVDMSKEPEIMNEKEAAAFIPSSASDKDLLRQRLQHFQYADKYLSEFVLEMYKQYPDSLFIITGDHADRWTLNPNPSLYERLAVPLVILGRGINKDLLPSDAAGSHMDIAATLLELILPKGETYYALGHSLLNGNCCGLHAYYWLGRGVLGELSSEKHEILPGAEDISLEEDKQIRSILHDEQTVTAWRVLHGLSLAVENE